MHGLLRAIFICTPCRIRTGDSLAENQMSWAARRTGLYLLVNVCRKTLDCERGDKSNCTKKMNQRKPETKKIRPNQTSNLPMIGNSPIWLGRHDVYLNLQDPSPPLTNQMLNRPAKPKKAEKTRL
mgnify:FL=1